MFKLKMVYIIFVFIIGKFKGLKLVVFRVLISYFFFVCSSVLFFFVTFLVSGRFMFFDGF